MTPMTTMTPMTKLKHPEILDKIIRNVHTSTTVDKKISIYSYRAMVLLRYMQLSVPELTRSDTAKQKLFEAIPEYHPEIWSKILKEIPATEIKNERWADKKSRLKRPNKPILIAAFDEIVSTQDKIIMIYSPQIATLFKYLRTTEIRFQTSTHGAAMLETILQKQFPKIWGEIDKLVES